MVMDEATRTALMERLEAERVEVEPVLAMVDWHCPGKHGVIRNVPKHKMAWVARGISFYFAGSANNGAWWTRNTAGTFDVEFYDWSASSHNGPSKPWNWCGETVLFKDWQARERATRQAAQAFRIGDKVTFPAKGGTIPTGIVIGGGSKNATVLVGSIRWRVSWRLLRSA